MHTLRDQACIVGVGETACPRGTQKSVLRLVLEASCHALADASLSVHNTVIYRALHSGFAPDVPYATVVIELAEGVRMVSHVLHLAPEQLRVGLPVAVVFDDVTPAVTLPKFRPLPPSAGV